MKSISISRAKAWESCKLAYYYTYVNQFTPVEKQTIDVTAKGIALHETFERLLRLENYEGDSPLEISSIKKIANELSSLQILQEECIKNKLSLDKIKEYRLDIGIKRWLNFKREYLDKQDSSDVLHAEQNFNTTLFGSTNTITIIDLLQEKKNGEFIIYDYKTPKTINIALYSEQLTLYAYALLLNKKIIQPKDFATVPKLVKLAVFFPLANGDYEDYEKSLKFVDFTAKDVENIVNKLEKTCEEIDKFDFNKPAEVLQKTCPDFQCKWCAFQGAAPQPDIKFDGCPLSHFFGLKQLNSEFKKV